jgi:hypothetical protein
MKKICFLIIVSIYGCNQETPEQLTKRLVKSRDSLEKEYLKIEFQKSIEQDKREQSDFDKTYGKSS